MHFGSKTVWLSLCVLAAALAWPAALSQAAPKKDGESKKSKTPKEKVQEEDDDGSAASNEKDPTTFAEAFERAKIAVDQREAAAVNEKMAEEQKDTETATKERQEKAAFEKSAFRMLRLALTLADKAQIKDPEKKKDVSEARYFLCFLNYQRGNLYESAVIGEFLARTTPDTLQGRQGAKIALASFRKMYDDSKQPEKDRTFEIEHIEQIAAFIIKQWPKEEEADFADFTLLSFAIQQRQLDKAIEYLKQLPEKSPYRPGAELRTGQALWITYLKAAQMPEAERPTAKQLELYRNEAQQILTAAVERMKKNNGDVNPTIASAMLSIAQIYLDKSENDKTIETLEDPTFGPLTLIKTKSPVVNDPFAIETYKVALRAYIAALNTQMATKVMNSLEKRIHNSGDPKADQILTQIYIGLARELQQHLERLRLSGNKKELESVSNAFDTFLKRIVERGGGASFSTQSWVAETFYGLAINFDDAAAAVVPEKAKGYYVNAVKGYEGILARVEKDPKFLPDPDKVIGIRLRMAISERRVGNFNSAIRQIAEILHARPKWIPIQVEGAETYQASGIVDPEGFMTAISGGERTPKGDNLIWGWGKLAKMTKDEPKFADTYFQARLKVAECFYLFALKTADKAKHDKYIDLAKKDIKVMYTLFPQLGGPESYAKYDGLLKKIQKDLGDKTNGLQDFKEVETKTAQDEK